MLTYASVCDGIGAVHLAWKPLGLRPLWCSEIAPFPSAVTHLRHPEIPNYGDLLTLTQRQDLGRPDVLVGGTPCQSFSIAGLRAGLADPRGNLALAFVALVDALRPRWVVWENVPGVLSVDGGRAFGSFLGGLGELGYGWAYRVMDAQYVGLAQRRKRVFVVASPGDWRRSAAVLFEPESLRWDSPPRRETGQGTTGTAPSSPGIGGVAHTLKAKHNSDHRADSETYIPTGRRDVAAAEVTGTLCNNGRAAGSATQQDAHSGMLIAHTLRGNGHDASEDGTGRGVPLVPIMFTGDGVTADPISATEAKTVIHQGNNFRMHNCIGERMGVRRLMPHELERLQGFPDHFTQVPYRRKPAADGPRSKALGNSMAVPVMAWIGRRMLLVDATPAP